MLTWLIVFATSMARFSVISVGKQAKDLGLIVLDICRENIPARRGKIYGSSLWFAQQSKVSLDTQTDRGRDCWHSECCFYPTSRIGKIEVNALCKYMITGGIILSCYSRKPLDSAYLSLAMPVLPMKLYRAWDFNISFELFHRNISWLQYAEKDTWISQFNQLIQSKIYLLE